MDPMALQPYEIGCLREREREKKKRRERQGERERETETESERARERERESDREGAPFVLFASQCLNGQVSYTLELIKKNSSLAFDSKSMILIGLRTCRLLCMLYVS